MCFEFVNFKHKWAQNMPYFLFKKKAQESFGQDILVLIEQARS